MTKRGVDLFNIFIFHAFRVQEGAQDLVRGARVNVVRSQQEEAFRAAAVLAHQVLHRRDRLLVRRRAGIEDVR